MIRALLFTSSKNYGCCFSVLFLSSKEAGFITGHTLDVNGGVLMD